PVEFLFIDFQTGVRKKFGRELFDCETDGIRGAGKPSISKRGSSPVPSPEGNRLCLAPGGKQLSHDAVIERSHSGLRYRQHRILTLQRVKAETAPRACAADAGGFGHP